MGQEIFISYRRRDASAFAARLRDRLETVFRGQVFLDVAGIDAGEDYVAKLASTVRESKAVVAVIGSQWASGGEARTRLGEPGDFVTAELEAAIEAGITVIPVLIDGARMPVESELPPSLQPLARRHGIEVTHAHFDSDTGHLIAALYRPLGIEPPGRIERLLEAMSGRAVDSPARRRGAWLSVGLAALSAGGLWAFDTHDGALADSLLPVAAAAAAIVAGLVGRREPRSRAVATSGVALAVLCLLAAGPLLAMRSTQTLREPWMEAGRLAQVHAQAPQLPASAVAWSKQPPFTGPPPTVACACLGTEAPAAPERPLPAGTQLVIANRCSGPVYLVAMRDATGRVAGIYPWFASAGREFAVLALAAGQGLRLPLGGAHGFALLPWICPGERPGP